jgi:hypothetical protein
MGSTRNSSPAPTHFIGLSRSRLPARLSYSSTCNAEYSSTIVLCDFRLTCPDRAEEMCRRPCCLIGSTLMEAETTCQLTEIRFRRSTS